MKLHTYEVRMGDRGVVQGEPVQFHDLHALAGVISSDETHAGLLQLVYVGRVDFIAVTVPFFNGICITI